MSSSKESWKAYREATIRLLKDVKGYTDVERMEGGQKVNIESGSECEVDVAAYRVGGEGIIVFECKRWERSIEQGALVKFHYSIRNSGVNSGIRITPIDLQECITKLAQAEKIIEIKLDFNSTSKSYIAKIVSRIFSRVNDEIAIHNNERVASLYKNRN
jgi:hypothetical protein